MLLSTFITVNSPSKDSYFYTKSLQWFDWDILLIVSIVFDCIELITYAGQIQRMQTQQIDDNVKHSGKQVCFYTNTDSMYRDALWTFSLNAHFNVNYRSNNIESYFSEKVWIDTYEIWQICWGMLEYNCILLSFLTNDVI